MYSDSNLLHSPGICNNFQPFICKNTSLCALEAPATCRAPSFVQIVAAAAPIWTPLTALCWTLTLRSCAAFPSQTTTSMPASSAASTFKVAAVLNHLRPPHTTLHNSSVSPFFPPRTWSGIPRLHSQCPSGSSCLPKLAHPQGDSS